MKRQKELGRKLRNVADHLTSSAQDIFGSADAVIYRAPDPAPEREDSPSNEHARTTGRPAGKGDRLPPRERRGRD